METPPGHVIRALREGLHLSQAELARALDWSPSTISAWERGRNEPSRLAFKIILAFAEGRGVRYRAKVASTALVPMARAPMALPSTVVVAGERLLPVRTEPARWEQPRERRVSLTAARPGWSAEATFRVSRPAGTAGERRGVGGAVGALGVVAATVCAALVVGLPGATRDMPAPAAVDRPAAAYVRDAAVRSAGAVAVAEAGPAAEAMMQTATTPTARLDGLLLVGDRHRATFRTGVASVTVPEGSQLGAQRVAAIAPDRVELVGPAGETRTVRLGHGAALE